MGRFLASYLAGILVIAGGWFGWTSAERVAEAVGATADLVTPGPKQDSAGSGHPDRGRAGPETYRPRFDRITLR